MELSREFHPEAGLRRAYARDQGEIPGEAHVTADMIGDPCRVILPVIM